MRDAADQYLGKKTTMASLMVARPGLDLPYITLCPGIKNYLIPRSTSDEVMWYPHLLLAGDTNGSAATSAEVEAWWNRTTYDLHEGMNAAPKC